MLLLLICCVLALAGQFASSTTSPSEADPDLFLTTLTHADLIVADNDKKECLKFLEGHNLKSYDDQRIFYLAGEIFFKYYQQARNELQVPNGMDLPTDRPSHAAHDAEKFMKQILEAVESVTKRFVVQYSTQPDDGRSDEAVIPCYKLKGDLILWHEISNLLYYLDQACFWLDAHHTFEAQYNEVVARMGIYLIDCMGSLLKQANLGGAEIVYTIRQPEGSLWLDCYRNFNRLHFEMDGSRTGQELQRLYDYYRAAFFESPVHELGVFRSMRRMFCDHLRAKYTSKSSPLDHVAVNVDKLEASPEVRIDMKSLVQEVISKQGSESGQSSSLPGNSLSAPSTEYVPPKKASWFSLVSFEGFEFFLNCEDKKENLQEKYSQLEGDTVCPVCLADCDPEEFQYEVKCDIKKEAAGGASAPAPDQQDNLVLHWHHNGEKVMSVFPLIHYASICYQCAKGTHHECRLRHVVGRTGGVQKCFICSKTGYVKQRVLGNIVEVLKLAVKSS